MQVPPQTITDVLSSNSLGTFSFSLIYHIIFKYNEMKANFIFLERGVLNAERDERLKLREYGLVEVPAPLYRTSSAQGHSHVHKI